MTSDAEYHLECEPEGAELSDAALAALAALLVDYALNEGDDQDEEKCSAAE
jgi:hypothetical protein